MKTDERKERKKRAHRSADELESQLHPLSSKRMPPIDGLAIFFVFLRTPTPTYICHLSASQLLSTFHCIPCRQTFSLPFKWDHRDERIIIIIEWKIFAIFLCFVSSFVIVYIRRLIAFDRLYGTQRAHTALTPVLPMDELLYVLAAVADVTDRIHNYVDMPCWAAASH